MLDEMCDICQAPLSKGVFPMKRTDYPDSWIPLCTFPNFNFAQWLPQKVKDTVLCCQSCQTLWYLAWDQHDQLLNAIRLGEDFRPLLLANSKADEFVDFLFKHQPSHGPVRSLFIIIGQTRFTRGNLQQHAELLLRHFSAQQQPLGNISILVILLTSVIRMAVKKTAAPTRSGGFSEQEEQTQQHVDTIDRHVYDKTVKTLPPIGELDFQHAYTWIKTIPSDVNIYQLLELRTDIRDLFHLALGMANRKHSVLTIRDTCDSQLEVYGDTSDWYIMVLNDLELQLTHAQLSELDITDVIKQLNKLEGMGKNLEKRGIRLLIKLRQRLSSKLNNLKTTKSIVIQIDYLLT